MENPNNPITYEIIDQDNFNMFIKMSHEQAKNLLNGGLCYKR